MEQNSEIPKTIINQPTEPIQPPTTPSPVETLSSAPKLTDVQTNPGMEGTTQTIDTVKNESVMPSVISKDVNVINPADAAEIRKQAQALIDAQNAKKPNLIDKFKNFLNIK